METDIEEYVMSVTVEDVTRYQHSGVLHPFTCRRCRGVYPDCPRKWRNRLLRRRDEHILVARPIGEAVILICSCCWSVQSLDEQMTEMVAFVCDK